MGEGGREPALSDRLIEKRGRGVGRGVVGKGVLEREEKQSRVLVFRRGLGAATRTKLQGFNFTIIMTK